MKSSHSDFHGKWKTWLKGNELNATILGLGGIQQRIQDPDLQIGEGGGGGVGGVIQTLR